MGSPRCSGALAAILALALGCSALKPAPVVVPTPKKYEAPDDRFVFFTSARIELAADGYFTIGYVAALLEGEPSFHVLIVGHADQWGPREANRDLSFKRARAVRKIFIDHGLKEARILIAAPREPDEATTSSLSRRVDLFIYDPVQEEASRRIGYPVEIRAE